MKTKLIALAVLAFSDYAFLSADVAKDEEFEVDAQNAEALLTAGKAKLAAESQTQAGAKAKSVKARVLLDCAYGKANAVVSLSVEESKQAEKAGVVDTDKASVAYAASLAQNQA